MGVNLGISKEGQALILKYKKQYWYLDEYSPQGKVQFNIKENNKYVFKLYLTDKQYAFMLKGTHRFIFSIIEPSGYNWGPNYSIDKNELIVFSDIMDKGEYTIEIYSPLQNEIIMEWGDY